MDGSPGAPGTLREDAPRRGDGAESLLEVQTRRDPGFPGSLIGTPAGAARRSSRLDGLIDLRYVAVHAPRSGCTRHEPCALEYWRGKWTLQDKTVFHSHHPSSPSFLLGTTLMTV